MKTLSVYVPEPTLEAAQGIAEAEKQNGIRSRNELLGSFLAFAVNLYPLLKSMRKRVEEVQRERACEYHEAIAHLVKLGLDAADRR